MASYCQKLCLLGLTLRPHLLHVGLLYATQRPASFPQEHSAFRSDGGRSSLFDPLHLQLLLHVHPVFGGRRLPQTWLDIVDGSEEDLQLNR